MYCLETIQWLGSQKDVKGYLCPTLCVRPCVCAAVCLLPEKTDRLAPGNTEHVVCGFTSRAGSFVYCARHQFEGVVLQMCVCVFAVSTRRRRKH